MRKFAGVIHAPLRYSIDMARGWESKSAEEQIEQQMEQRSNAAKAVSGKTKTAADAIQSRARQLLELKRERILSEKTSHPARRAALQAALQAIDRELEQLG
ncbi:MAG: hypothetical protein WA708_20595 [Acidobacteriaceae bacterium]